jgi:hypothetical protein
MAHHEESQISQHLLAAVPHGTLLLDNGGDSPVEAYS